MTCVRLREETKAMHPMTSCAVRYRSQPIHAEGSDGIIPYIERDHALQGGRCLRTLPLLRRVSGNVPGVVETLARGDCVNMKLCICLYHVLIWTFSNIFVLSLNYFAIVRGPG